MSIPHELRTPLTGVLGFTAILKDEMETFECSDESKELLDHIQSGALKLTKVINRFIVFTDTTIMANDPAKLFTLRKRILPSTSETIMQAAINLGKQYDRIEDIELQLTDTKIFFEETLFQYLVSELIENALKFSKTNSKVSIESKISGDKYVITFLDRGIGIKKDYLNKLSAFTQFDRSKHEIGGSGLGIATIMNILKIYNGKLEIESRENTFTRVEITLPLPKDANQTKLFN